MPIIFGFTLIFMLLFAGYIAYRLYLKRSLAALICLSLELFSITIALFSLMQNVKTSNTTEFFYILFGILLPGGFLVYDYLKLIQRIRQKGINEGLLDMANTFKPIKLPSKGELPGNITDLAGDLDNNPGQHEFYFNIGINLYQKGRFTEAIEAYKKALEIKPDNHEISCHLGAALMELKRYDEAVEAYKSALKTKSSDSELFYNLSVVYSLLQKREIALDNLKKAIEINSQFKDEAKNNKAFDFIKTNTEFKKLVS